MEVSFEGINFSVSLSTTHVFDFGQSVRTSECSPLQTHLQFTLLCIAGNPLLTQLCFTDAEFQQTSTWAYTCSINDIWAFIAIAMFSLIVGFFEYLFRKDELHVLILGLDKAGKTNVLERLKATFTSSTGLDPVKILPTVGLNVGRLDAFSHSFIFWDLGGQPSLRSIWDKYYNESHAVVYVVDAASRARFDESKAALDRILGSGELYGAPLLIMANKQDIENVADAQEVSDYFGIGKLDSRPCKVIPVCAYTGQGLKEGVEWLAESIRTSTRVARLRVKHAR